MSRCHLDHTSHTFAPARRPMSTQQILDAIAEPFGVDAQIVHSGVGAVYTLQLVDPLTSEPMGDVAHIRRNANRLTLTFTPEVWAELLLLNADVARVSQWYVDKLPEADVSHWAQLAMIATLSE